jgi:hypothetical protein
MSIIRVSQLSSSDLSHLGNNLDPAHHRPLPSWERTERRRQLAAINRSLACLGESVGRLHRPLFVAAAPAASRTRVR